MSISTIKPEDQEPISIIELNDKTYESYIKEGFEKDIPNQVWAIHDRIQIFKTAIGDRPYTRRVDLIKRIKTGDRKEWLVYHETIEGTTFLGESKIFDEHIVGFHYEQTRTPVINEQKLITAYKRGPQKEVYTIPYSQKKLDEIISNSQGSDKDTIKFHIKNPDAAQKDYFYYEQFILPWSECMNLLFTAGGPKALYVKQLIATKPKP